MIKLSLVLLLLFQVPAAPRVIVGLNDGQQLVVENPEFSGFIEGRNGDAVLMYRQQNFHGEMPMRTVSRIEFREYKKGEPFPMTVTLKNGRKLEVQSERRDFVSLKGRTEFGSVMIKHPDPLSAPVRLTTRKPNRKNDLTIQYLEFPGS
jgi:hypothetical protein